MNRVLNLTSAAAETIIQNPKLREKFHFIRFAHRQWAAPAGQKVKTCCGKNPIRSKRDGIIRTVKEALLVMNPAERTELKQILGVETIILFLGQGSRQVQKIL